MVSEETCCRHHEMDGSMRHAFSTFDLLLHHTCGFKQYCHVVNTAQQCRFGLFQDSDFAGNLEVSKSTSVRETRCFLTHSASRSNSVVWRLIQYCHVFFCAARDDRRLVVESLLCVFSIRSLLSDLES